MKAIKEIGKMKTYARIMKKENKLIGFIPTMGYLHEGHLNLMRTARKQADTVIASVFVNPMQFAPNEDFKKYPRDIKKDEELARACGVDVVFYPSDKDMYPPGFSTSVNVDKLTDVMEGASRPGHFKGVTTAVMKLFEIVKPDIAYFGQKDAQQAAVIKKMVEDLNMDITLKIMPTVREEDGLAMSSRNAYLSKPERKDAACLYESLKLAEEAFSSGEKNAKKIKKIIKDTISKKPSAKIDYISIVNAESLESVTELKGKALVALAVFVGKTRLIDNIILDPEHATKGEGVKINT